MEEQTQAAPTLCRMGCGFFGSSATEGMCSKCHRDYQLRKQEQSTKSSNSTSHSSPSAGINHQNSNQLDSASKVGQGVESTDYSEAFVHMMGGGIQATPLSDLPASSQATPTLEETPSPNSGAKSSKKNRCFMCRKKVGLTGFQCRCGQQFCALHRYADKHSCPFDYKTSGREELQKKHPKVVASKVQKL